jgi:2-phospho-L-lactate guanylyltransferase
VEVAVLLPVKDFGQAKARLALDVDPTDRSTLARWMATRVVAAALGQPVFVVCDSDAVAEWADSLGATVLWQPGVGLNAAATGGVAAIAAAGIEHVVVVHSDIPLAHDLAGFARAGAVTLVPDSRDDGTNVLSLPTATGFTFAYGARSFAAHRAEADRLGLDVVVVRDDEMALDVDTLDDLTHPLIRPLLHEVLPAWTHPTNPASQR